MRRTLVQGPRNSKWCRTAESELYAAVKTASEGAWDPARGNGLGDTMWAESTSGCFSNDVPSQSQRIWLGEARRHAAVDTGGIQVRQVRHAEGRHEREPTRFHDETDAEIENRAAYEHHGLRVHEKRAGRVEVSSGENVMALQISVLAVGYVRWIGGIRVPVTTSTI